MTTQNCAECGTPAEPGQSFCDACGAVLGWNQGARAAQPATPSPHPREAAPAARPEDGPEPGRPEPVGTAAAAPDPAVAQPMERPLPPGSPARERSSADAAPPSPGEAGRAADAADAAGVAGGTGAPGAPGQPRPVAGGNRSVAGGNRSVAGENRSGEPAWPDGAAGSGPAGTTGPAPARPGTPAPEETAPTRPVPAAPHPHPHPLSDTMSDRARSLLVPVADPEAPHPPAAAAAPVLPGRPEVDRPAVRAPGPQPGTAGGPPCRWCATPNPPDRHYCVRCAMPLAEPGGAAASVRPPWWRRLFGGQGRATPWAGERPRLRRVFGRAGTWITLAVVVALAVLGFAYLPDGIDAAKDHFAKRAPVAPDRITASRSYPGHQPELAFDKHSNTWWGPGVSQSGQGEWIEVTFGEPTRLLDVIITPGVSGRADKLGESALPHHVTATVTGKDGKVTTHRLTLDQGAGGQRRPFRVGEVTKVRFIIESSYAASADKQAALAEIEFFGPSNANR
ncbi:zinc ribbon domain-containing protein [Streptomyces sp. NBC_00536]|uniref:NADase-type glycan-binding domain-containing protein n=1 Tax=Streptomyces sp. NBC_00536 TaxID=2975769 RepID=UPI002E81C8A3|nr:zinc ribbon domain-containing protein [Streptomyces sp. NBC_00536]WUC83227.1 zinc ribbon domain-containing protein [Streptomyces sp. NBC_00536]